MDFARVSVNRSSALIAALLFAVLPATLKAQHAPQPGISYNAVTNYWWQGAKATPALSLGQAQASAGTSQPPTCALSALSQCLKDFLHDQAGIWTSPTRIRPHDALWLAPFAGATAAAIATDRRAQDALGVSTDRINVSNGISDSLWGAIGGLGVTYAVGSFAHKETLQETGRLGLEAVADSMVVVEGLKLATNRERPSQGQGHGNFWPHGTRGYPHTSFPSDHAASSWALASVVAHEYPNRPLLKVLVYSYAVAVSVARITARKHFPSDVLVGGTFGYLIGGYVFRHHAKAAD